MAKPRIGIIPGDPSGIGPELIAKLLTSSSVQEKADILLIGDKHVFEAGMQIGKCEFEIKQQESLTGDDSTVSGYPIFEMETIEPKDVKVAEVSKASGESVLKTLNKALDFASSGEIDAFMFGPFNKSAMHLANIGFDDELQYMANRLGVTGYISELNKLDDMWTSRVTSHIPLKKVVETISEERITNAILLIYQTLKNSGVANPRIAVAALNPHAGDNGNFGTEEIDLISPTIQKLAAGQYTLSGPWPSDTVFLKVVAGEFDAVVTMYHDQGQIALKLLGFDRGVSVLGGLPFPVATPAHGTAFDIAGKGIADLGATRAAFELLHRMVVHWSISSTIDS